MHEISIRAEHLFDILGWPITNALLLGLVSTVVLLVLGFDVGRNIKLIPGKLQSFFELIIEGVLDFMKNILGSEEMAEKYFPFITTIFLFILTSNWLGLLPFGGIMYHHTPIFRSPASDLNFTIALAIISVLATNLIGVVVIGWKAHLSKFFTLKNPILTFVGLLEFVSEFVKIISFSFRLFGNIFAGKVLLLIIAFLIPYVIPLPFLILEVFIGLIQAFIFSMLTLVFIGMAVQHHEEPGHQGPARASGGGAH